MRKPFHIEVEQEEDGRFIAEVKELPGVLDYGKTIEEAVKRVMALTLTVLADKMLHGEDGETSGVESLFATAK